MEEDKAKEQENEFSLTRLTPSPGSHHRKKIVGRGVGSGHGRHATRGMKGQRSRSGDGKMIGFEGGQMSILRRIPKRGFTPPFPRDFVVVNVQDLSDLFPSGAEVNPEILLKEGVIKKNLPLKILGNGQINKPLKVAAHAFSQQAKEKITKAGGTVECWGHEN